MFKVGVIGVGYWGPNIIRNFITNPKTEIDFCCDVKQERLNFIKSNYPFLKTTKNYNEIVKNPKIDLIAICTPVTTHYEIAKAAIIEGKQVLIEKPMTSNAKQSESLMNLAEQKGVKIFVDHTFIFTGAVRKMKELIENGEIGEIYYFDSVRINLGLFQHDVNVLWDLAPHDISIMHFLLNKKPESVVATGAEHLNNSLEDVAYLTIYYPNNLIAHIHANWLSPVKIRQTLIAGTKKMIVWDDNMPSEKIRVYDKGIEVIETADQVYNTLIQYRTGDMYCPKIDSTEALKTEINHIVEVLENDLTPLADGYSGWIVVKILEAANKSIRERGKEILIS
ncbi:MAG: Gfo/Idh/MocA family protein [Candidatus Helarchaeota archaeon]